MKLRNHVGAPPPRTVIGDPSPADGQGRNWWVPFSDLRSLYGAQNDAVRHYTLPHKPPHSDQQLARHRRDHGLATATRALCTLSKPMRQHTVLLAPEQSPRQFHHPTPHASVAAPAH